MGNLSRESQERLMRERQRQAYLARKKAKKRRRRRFIRFLIFVLAFTLAFLFYENGFSFDMSKFKWDGFKINIFKKKDNDNKNKSESYKSAMEGEVIAYVPIDDRAIHTTRIEYLAKSAGFELKMPESKYYKTHLGSGENSYPEFNTKYGNPAKISSWLLELDQEGCDYYIISIDQMFSGGLVGSQYLTDEDIEIYGQKMDYYKKVIASLASDKNNHIYFIDSVMGLSITPGAGDVTEETAKNLVAFSNVERKTIDSASLTIDNINKQYKLDKDGKEITTPTDEILLYKYLNARKRKLKYTREVIETLGEKKNKNKNVHLYIGIDDSGNSSVNIQNNDIAFIEKVAKDNEVKIIMRDGVSSLSEFAFADMQLDAVTKKIRARVTYYGDDTLPVAGTKEKYKDYMSELLKDLNISEVSKKQDFDILVYNTTVDEKNESTTNSLLNQYLENIQKQIPTVIINDADLTKDQFLINNLIDYDKTGIPMGYLIGYSNWNGFMNSSRIGVAEGVTRILYLKGVKNKKDEMDKNFVMSMGLSFAEDIGYQYSYKTGKDLKEVEQKMKQNNKLILGNLTQSNIISDLNPYDEKGIRDVSISNSSFPWERYDEITIKLYGYTEDRHPISIPEKVSYENKKEG